MQCAHVHVVHVHVCVNMCVCMCMFGGLHMSSVYACVNWFPFSIS